MAQTLAFCLNKRQRLRTSCSSAKKARERVCPMIHHAQLLKLDFTRRISNLVSNEIVDKFPPLFELFRLLFGYRFHCRLIIS